MRILSVCSSLICVMLLLPGCSEETRDKITAGVQQAGEQVKAKTNQAVSQAKELAGRAGDLTSATDFNGSAMMTLDGETKFNACYVQLVPLPSSAENGSSTLLQVTNTRDNSDSFPGFLLQGETKARNLSELIGSSVLCQVFAQNVQQGAVWSNQNLELIAVTIEQVDDRYQIQFSQGQLKNSETGSVVVADGRFDCVEH